MSGGIHVEVALDERGRRSVAALAVHGFSEGGSVVAAAEAERG